MATCRLSMSGNTFQPICKESGDDECHTDGKGKERWAMIADNIWDMILGKAGALAGPLADEIIEKAKKEGRTFFKGNPQDNYPDQLDMYRKMMAEKDGRQDRMMRNCLNMQCILNNMKHIRAVRRRPTSLKTSRNAVLRLRAVQCLRKEPRFLISM